MASFLTNHIMKMDRFSSVNFCRKENAVGVHKIGLLVHDKDRQICVSHNLRSSEEYSEIKSTIMAARYTWFVLILASLLLAGDGKLVGVSEVGRRRFCGFSKEHWICSLIWGVCGTVF